MCWNEPKNSKGYFVNAKITFFVMQEMPEEIYTTTGDADKNLPRLWYAIDTISLAPFYILKQSYSNNDYYATLQLYSLTKPATKKIFFYCKFIFEEIKSIIDSVSVNPLLLKFEL